MALPPTERAAGGRRATVRLELAALALFVVLAVFQTWPLASAPGTYCRNDNGDAVLNEWIVAWVAHQIVTDPVHLFDANIFYPERRTLAYSEHMLPQALIAAPALWNGASPVLAFNLALLAGFVLTGWAMAHVVRKWTGSWTAGMVAGSLAAFNAHTLTRLGHLQAQHLEFLPLALLALDRLLQTPRVRHALTLAAWFALQALTSGYFLLFSAVAMVSAAAVRPAEWVGRHARKTVPLLLLAAGVAGLVLLPFLLPYWWVREEQGLVRNIGEVASYSAIPTDYLATGSLLHAKWWSQPFFRGDALFPGVTAILLVLTALVTGVAVKDRRARMCLAVTVACACLSFGVNFPPYPWLFRHVPLFDGLRAVIRFGHVALLAFAAVAGFGASWWLARVASRRTKLAVAAAMIVAVNVEAWRGPLWYFQYQGIPRIYKSLASAPNAVVAHFPMSGQVLNARYMLASTLHWKPMLNGYSGYVPRSYGERLQRLGGFPDAAAVEYLRSAGVTHVVVESRYLSTNRLALLAKAQGLRLWVTDGSISIYLVQ